MGILSQSSWYGEKSSTGQHQRELLISVIVPIYKVEAYLDRCVQSIVDQTYANLEILLVDDGSPDRCPEICDAWSQRDPRIRVIHKKNGGLSDARNVGIDAAKGDWLAFVDSDDYIMPQMYQRLLSACLEHQADVAVSSYFLDYGTRKESLKSTMLHHPHVFSRDDLMTYFFRVHPVELVVAWNKLYRRNLFFDCQKIRYPVGRLHEDEFTSYKLFHAANRIVWLPDELYAYVQRDGSIMANYSVRNLRDIIACAKDSFSWSANVAPQWRKAVECDAFRIYLGTVQVCHQKLERQDYEELLHEWESFLQAHIHAYFRNPYVTTKDRVKYILYRLHFFFFIQAFRQKCFPQQ